MEKIAFFNTTSQKARWMIVCLVILTVIAVYQQILHGYLVNNHDGVLAIALYKLSTTSLFPVLLYLANITCVCYMYDALRRAAKHSSTMINVLCWIVIFSKVFYVLFYFLYQFLYPDSLDSISGFYSLDSTNSFYSSHLFITVRVVCAIACFLAIFLLCVCLIRNYTGRIKTLGILWLSSLLFVYVIELFFLLVTNIPDSVIVDSLTMNLLSVSPYIYLICGVIPLFFIYRCFKIA